MTTSHRPVNRRIRCSIALAGVLLLGGCSMIAPRDAGTEGAHQPRFWVEIQEEEDDAVTFGISFPWSN